MGERLRRAAPARHESTQRLPSMIAPRCIGILLAAGRGKRFDPQGVRSKLLQPIAGREVVSRACLALAAGCDQVIAVVRPDSPAALSGVLRQVGAQVVICPDADLGMGHSLAAAARTLIGMEPAPEAVMVMPADMPWMRSETVQALRQYWNRLASTEQAICIAQPMLPDGRRGHPVLFGRTHFEALSALTGDAGARGLLRTHPPATVTVDDAGILQDIDVPSDLPPS